MIFYFSGTGNTRWAAQKLAEATGERLLFVPDELKGSCNYHLDDSERIGFCFPVHGWQPPHIIKQFLQKLTFNTPSNNMSKHYCYVVVTCGDSAGEAIKMFSNELMAKGLNINFAISLIMPESYVCLPFMYTDTPQREAEKIAQATKDLDVALDIILNKQSHLFLIKKGPIPWFFSYVVGAYFNKKMISDKKFSVDEDLCIHCGKCSKVCPTGDIVITNGLPEWKHDNSCTNCLNCYHHCPKHAINYGRITKKRGQYYFGHRTATSGE